MPGATSSTPAQISEQQSSDSRKNPKTQRRARKVVPNQTAQSLASGGPKDETRKYIAKVYVFSFLGIVGATLFLMLLECYSIIDIKDILLAESGILSGPLGFIIGFYFKEELDKKDGS